MPPRRFIVYDRGNLAARIKALGPRIRAQGGMPCAGEYPSRTETLLEICEFAEDLLERGDYQKTRHPI